MADIATRWLVGPGLGDWAISAPESIFWTDENGNSIVDEDGQPINAVITPGEGLATGNDLLTAVLISVFTDAVADADDVVPDGGDDRRGWWAGPIGSKIWLRARSKALPLTLALVRDDLERALAWLIDDGIVASIDVATEWTRPGLLGARVLLLRRDGTRRALAFSRLWETT